MKGKSPKRGCCVDPRGGCLRSLGAGALLAAFVVTSCSEAGVGLDADRGQSALLTVSDCPAGYNVIEGTNLDDNLRGTNKNDCILGYDGNDVIRGRRGDDYLVGGPGDDEIYGGNGDDQIFGEDGADTIRGDRGVDTIQGGSGADMIRGDDGNDVISGGDGADVIEGGQGHDELSGDAGNDEIVGDRGDDLLDGGDGNDVLSGGDGTDVVYGGAGDDTISDPDDEDVITDNVGTGAVEISLNTWPVVDSLIPNPTRIDVGESTQLDLTASDPDSDSLTYSWSAGCSGTFSDALAEDPTFTLDADNSGAPCALTVTVNDGRGGQTTGSITIATGTIEPSVQGGP